MLSLSHLLLHFSPLQIESLKTQQEAQQFHALSLKLNFSTHPSIPVRLLSLYTNPTINNLSYAESIFNRIPNPTLFLYNILLKCYVQNQQSHQAITLFRHLMDHHLVPDAFTLPIVVKACARLNAIKEGMQIHGLLLKIGFGFEKFVQGSLVNMYAKCGEIEFAREVFDKMGERDLVSWNSLIDGYAKSGQVDLALELFEEMPERDLFSWTALVDGFSKCKKIETAREIFDRMPERNLVSWNAMINGYMKCGHFDTALELFYRMPTKNLISLNSMIAGYEFNGRFVEALELFKDMLIEGVVPNHATLASVLSAVSGLAILSKGRWIHSYMIKNGVESDGVLGILLIEMYSKCGSIDSALTVFQSIQAKKVGHWTAIIVGLGMHGMAERALKQFHEMCRIGLEPHAITFIGVLNACSHARLVDDGRRYFDMMVNDYGIEPAIEHYGCLVDILCRVGCLEEAKNIIGNMPMRPNKVIWMSLLSGSRNFGNIDMGEYAANQLIELAPETIGCYVVLSNIYAAADGWDKVSQVREMMKKRGIRKDPGCSSLECKGVLHRFIVGDKSHSQTEKIYSKLSEMRKKLKIAGHVPDTTQVLLCIEGVKEKEVELETHSERLAIAFGLINVEPRSPIRIMKNLRVCNDCHTVTKFLSDIYNREIIVRDNSRFHHFKNGLCSCNDFW
ncbi:PPR domain-containing protein/PPR_3 domain-containing protein/DYW_deaminase domain-containing protein [Cephalotus follicularis]|uniref:PPR domain-containing protein/PPR_3 domain-containing protein/DYW_deaminase domain-containing protein n=1 Tax=Cephalotus follicularis TaxID=3775 RepID=A0A1Q3CE54_CEPFO|nr:PPR domain-containing protein/PPR_3 domain-containing protein/DYW_deaminase domain-containing protein [Cephalotus follicularis]